MKTTSELLKGLRAELSVARAALRTWADDAVLKTVRDVYAAYHDGRFSSEPVLTASCVAEWIIEGGTVDLWNDEGRAFRDMHRREQQRIVRDALRRLTRRGLLETSVAMQGNKEVRAWEPKREDDEAADASAAAMGYWDCE